MLAETIHEPGRDRRGAAGRRRARCSGFRRPGRRGDLDAEPRRAARRLRRSDARADADAARGGPREIRERRTPPSLVFTSTNEVYGALDDVARRGRRPARYSPADPVLAAHGVDGGGRARFAEPLRLLEGGRRTATSSTHAHFNLQRRWCSRTRCICGRAPAPGPADRGWVVGASSMNVARGAPCRSPSAGTASGAGRGLSSATRSRRCWRRSVACRAMLRPGLRNVGRRTGAYDQPDRAARAAGRGDRGAARRPPRPVAGDGSALLRVRDTPPLRRRHRLVAPACRCATACGCERVARRPRQSGDDARAAGGVVTPRRRCARSVLAGDVEGLAGDGRHMALRRQHGLDQVADVGAGRAPACQCMVAPGRPRTVDQEVRDPAGFGAVLVRAVDAAQTEHHRRQIEGARSRGRTDRRRPSSSRRGCGRRAAAARRRRARPARHRGSGLE